MAEEESEVELDRLKEELESLLVASARDEHGHISKSYCAKFCKLVEEHTGRWQVPLPQLQVLRWALCSFVRGTASFPPDCEHVRFTLSSLALSVFELLLFFGKDEFPEDPLKGILDSFQECQACLVRHQNVYLLQLRQIIRDGGPWAGALLQGILKGAPQATEEVSRFLGSEACVFLELRVRYLLVCERVEEAMALAKACSQHPSAGRHQFFLQAYLTCLWKASFHDRLRTQMSVIDGKDAVEIICGCEGEEDDELLVSLSRGFLSQQLRNGDMFNLWDLVFVWSKLQLRANPSTEDFLQQCQQLIFTARNICAVFPFIKIILAEVGKCGLRFCVELCAWALESDLQSDQVTKSLLYKTVAFLLPADLEVCRVCALLVFFLERTVESYQTVSLLYTHPDVEYCADASPVGNHVRFEVLQILKKGLYFDPEFWNLLTLRTTCASLLSDPLAKAELTEILVEEPWAPTCCVREPCVCHFDPLDASNVATLMPSQPASEQTRPAVTVTASERPRVPGREAPCRVVGEGKRRGRKPGSKLVHDSSSALRRSFRQLDMAQQNMARQVGSGTLSRQQRVLSRQAERRCWKRRGRKPRWLLEEEAAAQAENSAPGRGRRPGRKPGRRPQTPPGQMRTYERNRSLAAQIQGLGGDWLDPAPPHGQTSQTLVLSQPDNELVDTWTSESPSSPAPRCVPERCAKVSRAAEDASLLRLLQMFSESGAEGSFQTHNPLAAVRQFHSYAKAHQEQGVQLDAEPDAEPTLELAERRETPAAASEPQVVEVVEVEVATFPLAMPGDVSASAPLDGAEKLSQAAATEDIRLTTEPKVTAEDGFASDGVRDHKDGRSRDNNHLDSCDALRHLAGPVAAANSVTTAQMVPVSVFGESTPLLCVVEPPAAIREPEVAGQTVDRTPGSTPQRTQQTPLVRTPTKSEPSHTNMPQAIARPFPPALQEMAPCVTPASALAPCATPASALVPAPAPAPQPELPPPPPLQKMVLSAPQPPLPAPEPYPREAPPLTSAQLTTATTTEPPALEAFASPATPQQHTPAQTTSVQHTPVQMTPVQHTPAEMDLAQHTPAQTALPSAAPGTVPPESPVPASPFVPESPVLVHCCRLCDKVFRGGNVMRHAYSHYRGNQLLSAGKCMFCDEPPADPDAVHEHFSRHVAQLRAALPPVPVEARENGTAHGQQRPALRTQKKKRGWWKRKAVVPEAEQAPEGAVVAQSNSTHHPPRPNGKIRKKKRRVQQESEEEEEEEEKGSGRRGRRPLRPRTSKYVEDPTSSESLDDITAEGGVASQPPAREQPVTAKPTKHTDKQANKQTNKQINKQLHKQTNKRTNKQLNKQTNKQPNKVKRKAQKPLEKAGPPTTLSSQAEGAVQDAGPVKPGGKPSESSGLVPGQPSDPLCQAELVACPVEWCQLRLRSRGSTVLGHLLQDHPAESAAFRSAFEATDGRCTYCSRRFHAFQHFHDHVGRHCHASLRHPCPHQGCPEAFRRLGDMREHVKERHAHALRMQCCFAGCMHTAQTSMELHRHERKHYVNTHRQRRPRVMPQNGEVRVAAKSAPPPVSGSAVPPPPLSGSAVPPPVSGTAVPPSVPGTAGPPPLLSAGAPPQDQVPAAAGLHSELKTLSPDSVGTASTSLGGESKGGAASLVPGASDGSPQGLVNGHSSKAADSSHSGTGVVAEPKAEPEVPAGSPYGRVGNKPFVRPLPCAYLDERYTSMPKRRKDSAPAAVAAAGRPVAPVVEAAAGSGGASGVSVAPPQRQRCSRCFTSLASADELQEHLKKCSALFGFDSDEEGGW